MSRTRHERKPKVAEKWRLSVYGTERPRYADGNHRWTREYPTRSAANRAAAPVHRLYPGTVGELSRFTLTAPMPIWTCYGQRDVDVFELWNDEVTS
jgi:hypothetical protein